MGKGRDKRKKHEDPEKAVKRATRQVHKRAKGKHQQGCEGGDGATGFNNEEAPEVTLNRIRKLESKTRTTTEEENIQPPSPRANVVFAPHPERDHELLVFGGECWDGEKTVAYNDLYFYHTKRSAWSRLVTAVNPPPRSSSQGVVYKHYFLICGGEFVSQSQSQFLHFKDVWRFDARKYEWEELKTLKGGPSSRSGHRMCLWRRSAVLFGGFYDNAQECHYYNDLWVLSHLDGAGKWTAIKTSPYAESPQPRSGHCMAVHNDTLFVFGGFSTEKFNRFKKSQATVHHDLWTIKLQQSSDDNDNADNFAVWTKVRLGGIPPPIRCGVSCAFKDKKMYLFGGVVDIESPGGKVVSSFNNDLFIFHMDTKRFYPVVLRAKKTTKASTAVQGDLQAELRALHLQHLAEDGSASDDEDADEEEDDDDGSSELGENEAAVDSTQLKESFSVNQRGQIYPHRRMNASTIIVGNTLYIFGGQFECGAREVTMADLFALNLNTCDSYRVLLSQDLSAAVWLGKEAEASDAGSWESGSTVVSAAFDLDYDEDDLDDDDEVVDGGVDLGRIPRELQEGDDGDEAPLAIPAELNAAVTLSREVVDGITTVKGKKGLKVHKEQLLAQLSAGFSVPTPLKEENAAEFFTRTTPFWLSMAKESLEDGGSTKRQSERRIQKLAGQFSQRRYNEAKKLLEQLRLVEEREEEEARFFRERREQKEREWEAYEQQLAAEDEEKEEEAGEGEGGKEDIKDDVEE
ncbi:kelch repeat-containing protein [Trypanosoma grayi]|uniref:kelch repeat-containing protein n=1 Tax=Trypanosoma grayi TaxID=71804 RepID=UPI0004F45012|nr:kelch repeat-containing protein [Trypanosoma grayi]KEG08977.1 kelch repeat-containing protein [Trypanosoma grayi]